MFRKVSRDVREAEQVEEEVERYSKAFGDDGSDEGVEEKSRENSTGAGEQEQDEEEFVVVPDEGEIGTLFRITDRFVNGRQLLAILNWKTFHVQI